MKGDKMAKRSSFGSMVRRRLSDITNTLPQTKSPVIPDNFLSDAASAKEYVDYLVKEKMALVKLIKDKNKVIELSGIEIQNLRNCLHKMQQQNWSLAQSNSNMLVELNLGRGKLKALQHELVCKEALLKAKNIELKQREELNAQKNEHQGVKETEVVGREPGYNEENKHYNTNRRRPHSRSRSLGSSRIYQQLAEKEELGSKRRCMRRQSASSRIRHEEPTENLFEIDDAIFPVAKPSKCPTPEVGRSSISSQKNEGIDSNFSVEGSRRTSMTRPVRKAVEKVHTYREIPINVKMRRSE